MSALTVSQANDMLAANFAPWVRALGLGVTETSREGATVRLPQNAELNRVGGTLCGQAIMALADTAMVIALCAAAGEFRGFPTVDVNTTFMRPVSNAGVVARATVLRMGKTMAFVEARIHTDAPDGPLVAHVTGTYVVPPPQ
jgi:uncharacterized protein (TIGR00369 family)